MTKTFHTNNSVSVFQIRVGSGVKNPRKLLPDLTELLSKKIWEHAWLMTLHWVNFAICKYFKKETNKTVVQGGDVSVSFSADSFTHCRAPKKYWLSYFCASTLYSSEFTITDQACSQILNGSVHRTTIGGPLMQVDRGVALQSHNTRETLDLCDFS